MRIFGLEITRATTLSNVGSGGWSPVIREPYAGAWQRNVEWRVESVLAHPTVYACVTLIADDMAKLRPRLVQQDDDGIWTEVRDRRSPFLPILRHPNHFQNHQQFKELWAISKLVHGNAYILKERDGRGIVRAMYVLDPNRVAVLVAPNGEVFYQLRADNVPGITEEDAAIPVPASEIIHDRMSCLFHPLVGVSPLFAAGGPASMGLEIEHGSRTFFGSGSNPSGILSSPASIPPDKAAEMREQWKERYGPGGPGGIAVLGFGMTFSPMRMTAADSQLIEQLKWSDESVCKAFKVPPFKVGVGQMPTYQNGELLNQRYYDDCLQRHIEAWEELMDEAFGFSTLTEGRQLGVDLDLDGLLRMDSATQIDTLVKAAGGPVMTPDEARRKIDMQPLVGGSTIYKQHQDYPIEQVFNRKDLDPAPAAPPPADQPPALPPAEDEADRAARMQRHVSRRARSLRMRTMAA